VQEGSKQSTAKQPQALKTALLNLSTPYAGTMTFCQDQENQYPPMPTFAWRGLELDTINLGRQVEPAKLLREAEHHRQTLHPPAFACYAAL
jgi:hypothetical protein